MWSTTRPTPIEKPGWTTDPALPTPVLTQEWATKFTRKFAVEATPEIGMLAAVRTAAAMTLAADPSIGMVARPHHSAEFGLVATPSIGMALPPPIPAGFTVAANPSIGMTATERYARDLVLGVTPTLEFVAAERYARSFGLVATPGIGMAAQQHLSAAFSLTATPTLGFSAVKAPVRFDASTDLGSGGGSSNRTGTHTLNGNCIVVVFINTTSTAATCTFGGQTIPRVYGPTQGGIVWPYNAYVSIFALVNNSLPQGPQTVALTQASTASSAAAMSFRNAGSIGTVIGDTASGNVSQSLSPVLGQAAVCGYCAGTQGFGTLTPNQAMNYGYSSFVTWAALAGWGLDSGAGVNFASSHSSTKAGAVVPILPAT